MKRTLWLLALCAVLLLGLSGCDLYQPDVDSLLSPPVLSELQNEVDLALQDVVGEDFKLRYPSGGSYRSPYIFSDLDGDGAEEAVVFYTTGEEPLVYLQVLDRQEGRWRAYNALPGLEGEVLFVDFRHLQSNSITDLLVGWSEPDLQYNTLCLYRYQDNSLTELFRVNYDGIAVADFDGNGTEELVTATLDSGVMLQLTGWDGSGISVLDTTYSSLRLQNLNEAVIGQISPGLPGAVFYGRINADMTASLAVGVRGDRLILPQETSEAYYADSYCYSGAVSADINGDGIIELPWSAAAPGYTGAGREEIRYFTEYRSLQEGKSLPVAVSCESIADGWRWILPESLTALYRSGSLSLVRLAETREVVLFRYNGSLSDYGQEYLRLRVVAAADSPNGFEDTRYTLLATRGQFSYYALLPSGSPLTAQQIEQGFSLLG